MITLKLPTRSRFLDKDWQKTPDAHDVDGDANPESREKRKAQAINAFTKNAVLCSKCNEALPRLGASYSSCNYGTVESYDQSEWFLPRDFYDDEPYYKQKPYWAWSLVELESSSKICQGCKFLCKVIRNDRKLAALSILHDDKIVLLPAFIGSFHHGAEKYNRVYRFKLQVYHKQPEIGRWTGGPYAVLFPLAGSADRWEGGKNSQLFCCRLVLENANMGLIKHWFHQCSSTHGVSQQNTGKGKPSHQVPRLCEPDPEALPEEAKLRVIDVKKECIVVKPAEARYVALSYVWGTSERLVLTEANRSRLETEGGLSDKHDDVPRTFRDAILLASSLDIDYVWIDALCILQDNSADLVLHMDSMAAIYSVAALTIVSNTNSVNTGIPGLGYPRVQSQVFLKSGRIQIINARPTFTHALAGSAWESRGWTLQEKVFSKRLLIFTEDQVFYHCSQATWFEDTILEDSSRGLVRSINLGEHYRPMHKAYRKKKNLLYEAHVPLHPTNFLNLVEVYMQRKLSFEQDILYAFAGVLATIRSKHGKDIWGMPTKLFVQSMAWKFRAHRVSHRRKGFPSWSWAGWKASDDVLPLRFENAVEGSLPIDFMYHEDSDGRFLLHQIGTYRGVHSWQWTPTEWREPNLCYDWLMPDHPGGATFTLNTAPELLTLNSTLKHPPLSQILRIRTSVSLLAIDAKPVGEEKEGLHNDDLYGYSSSDYLIRKPETGTILSAISLDPEWRANQGPGPYLGEFIVISTGFHPPSDEEEEDDSPHLLNIMLIERPDGDGGGGSGDDLVAYRVNMLSNYIDLNTWRNTNPTWKEIQLA